MTGRQTTPEQEYRRNMLIIAAAMFGVLGVVACFYGLALLILWVAS